MQFHASQRWVNAVLLPPVVLGWIGWCMWLA
jgi:hypothetical protein